MVENPQQPRTHISGDTPPSRWIDQHVFQPIAAVGYLLRDPGRLGIFIAAEPVRPESQDLAVEAVLECAIMHDEADVNDVIGESAGRKANGGYAARLYELDAITFRIAHLEPAVLGRCGDGLRNLNARLREIVAHSFGIRRREGDVVEAIDGGSALWQGQYFDKLQGAEVITHAEPVFRIRAPGCPQVMNIDVLRRGWIGCINGNVRDPNDWRPRVRGECDRCYHTRREPERTVAQGFREATSHGISP